LAGSTSTESLALLLESLLGVRDLTLQVLRNIFGVATAVLRPVVKEHVVSRVVEAFEGSRVEGVALGVECTFSLAGDGL